MITQLNTIEATIQAIKKSPMDLNLRLSLIQLYILEGEWQQALKTTLGFLKLNPKDEQSKNLLLTNIECEIFRQKVFTNEAEPTGYIGCEQHIIDFQKTLLQDYFANASQQAVEEKFINFIDSLEYNLAIKIATDAQPNTVSGMWLDTDMRTACVIEFFCQGQYYWLPISDIKRLIFKPNEILTDVVWRRADIELNNGHTTAGFIPARYILPTSLGLTNDLKHAKLTTWQEQNGFMIGLGQKVFSDGEEDVSILDIIEISN